MQKDRLGSTTQILDETGQVLHTKNYDAFGKPRNGDWTDMTGGLFQSKLAFDTPLLDAAGNLQYDINGDIIVAETAIDISKRGFTDHEHLDEMQLIHMNGRMYDYNNGRFLSVDPFIQSPTSTQSMNPYTYIFNNPLSGVDPTGYRSTVGFGGQSYSSVCIDGMGCIGKGGGGDPSKLARNRNKDNGIFDMSDFQLGDSVTNSGINNQPAISSNKPKTKKTLPKGFTSTQALLDAFKKLRRVDVDGPNKNIETKFTMDDKGDIGNTTQDGCVGSDKCTWSSKDLPKNKVTTLMEHTHVEAPATNSASLIKNSRTQGNEQSRNAPGPGDASPLQAGYLSGIITADGSKYIIFGNSKNPVVLYLGGGTDVGFGKFIEKNWKPNNKHILKISRDYLKAKKKAQKLERKKRRQEK